MRSSKYGASNRKLHDKATRSKNERYECPKCHKLNVVSKGFSLWICKSCKTKFAGAAYSMESEAGQIAKRLFAEYAKIAG